MGGAGGREFHLFGRCFRRRREAESATLTFPDVGGGDQQSAVAAQESNDIGRHVFHPKTRPVVGLVAPAVRQALVVGCKVRQFDSGGRILNVGFPWEWAECRARRILLNDRLVRAGRGEGNLAWQLRAGVARTSDQHPCHHFIFSTAHSRSVFWLGSRRALDSFVWTTP